jgi:hypothetical protein
MQTRTIRVLLNLVTCMFFISTSIAFTMLFFLNKVTTLGETHPRRLWVMQHISDDFTLMGATYAGHLQLLAQKDERYCCGQEMHDSMAAIGDRHEMSNMQRGESKPLALPFSFILRVQRSLSLKVQSHVSVAQRAPLCPSIYIYLYIPWNALAMTLHFPGAFIFRGSILWVNVIKDPRLRQAGSHPICFYATLAIR